jgi:predicted DsbA family dithiol-disulfide isomerase
LAKKYGTDTRRAQAMIDRLVEVAAGEGLLLDFENIKPGNTFDAHRLLHLAKRRGRAGVLKERFLRGYFCEGAAIGDADTLLHLATFVGLDVDEVQGVLSSDLYASDVRADEEQAGALGVDGVPFFVIGGRYAVAGAQPAALLSQALTRAWSELPERAAPSDADVAICGPDGTVTLREARARVARVARARFVHALTSMNVTTRR